MNHNNHNSQFYYKNRVILKTLIALIISNFIYLLVGGFIFSYFESNYSNKYSNLITQERNKCLKELWTVTEDLNILYKENWTESIYVKIAKYENQLLQILTNFNESQNYEYVRTRGQKTWTFLGAFYYSFSLVTITGDSTSSPRSFEGKLLTILYAIVGIPLMFVVLSNVASFLLHLIQTAISGEKITRQVEGCKVNEKMMKVESKRNGSTVTKLLPTPTTTTTTTCHQSVPNGSIHFQNRVEEVKRSERKDDVITALICLSIFIIYLLICSVVFSKWYHCTLLDGVYYFLLTFTTIDFQNKFEHLNYNNNCLLIFILFFGLIFVTMIYFAFEQISCKNYQNNTNLFVL